MHNKYMLGILICLCLNLKNHHGLALNLSNPPKNINRRDALISAISGISTLGCAPLPSFAEEESLNVLSSKPETIDLAAIKAAQSKSSTAGIAGSATKPGAAGVVSITDPPPLLSIRGGIGGKASIKIPRVGFSLYKTKPEISERSVAVALRSGVTYFDVGSSFASNSNVSIPLKKFLDVGPSGLDYSNDKPELIDLLDATKKAGEDHALATLSSGLAFKAAPPPMGSAGRKGRREQLFISHKLSNAEQSTHRIDVKRAVQSQIATLGTSYLDMVSIHSPLTDKDRRRETYAALLELRDQGFVRSVGVCNYGVGALAEIKEWGFDLPSVNQIELSPFNTHVDVVSWCRDNGIVVGCGAWSKLSGADGPEDQWAVVSDIANKKGMTKAQVLVRWSLQKGYICVPRSSASSKVERVAIAENSYGGVNRKECNDVLTKEEMDILDSLNIDYKAGKLGRRDGWSDEDVTGADWEPTDFV